MRKLLAAMLCAAAAACGGGGNGNGNGTQTVATPVFSQAGGTFNAPLSVAITCATAGATIRYTTDGSTPGASSPVYAGPVAIATTGTTLKAYATHTDYTDSAVASATYVLQAATPTFTPGAGSYVAAQSVTLATATPLAAIHYTTDGSAPTSGSPTYAAPVQVSTGTTTIRAIAIRAGFLDSAAASATYVVNPELPIAAAPTFSPAAGTYGSAQNVELSSATVGATIHYTTNGADPTTASAVYSTPIAVATTTTIKALATASGHAQSAIASATYTITAPQQVATPTFSPAPGTYNSAQDVTISCATTGAAIYYTTNGADPTTASDVYSAPVRVASTTTLKAMATRAGFTPSAVASGTYTISQGTDFATLCTVANTTIFNLFVACMHANPAIEAAIRSLAGFPCNEIARHSPGLVDYDPIAGQACVAAYQAMTCDDVAGDFQAPAACDAAIVGKVASGGTCHDSVDCAAGFCTVDFTQSCPGTCQPFAQAGQGCATAECAAGLVCDAGTCQTAHGVGQACPCTDALWCDAGTCRLPQKSGACDPAAFDQCALGYACVDRDPAPATADFQCTAMVGAGGDCALSGDLCGLGYLCEANVCVSWPTLGQSCAAVPLCAGAWCNPATETCEALRSLGISCASDFECASGHCNPTSNVCTLGYCVMP